MPSGCRCSSTAGLRDHPVGLSMNWRPYGLSQLRGAAQGPVTVMVHMASVWVPFTSESGSHRRYPEIQRELRFGLQAVGRKLGMYSPRNRVKQEGERRSIFLRYLGEVATAVGAINSTTGSAVRAFAQSGQAQNIRGRCSPGRSRQKGQPGGRFRGQCPDRGNGALGCRRVARPGGQQEEYVPPRGARTDVRRKLVRCLSDAAPCLSPINSRAPERGESSVSLICLSCLFS